MTSLRGDVIAGVIRATSFPGSLSPRPQEGEKRDPGCGWSRDLGDKPKPQGGLFFKKILSTVQIFFGVCTVLHCDMTVMQHTGAT